MRTRRGTEGIRDDVIGGLLEGCQVIGFDFSYLYVNDAVAAQARTSKDQLVGRTMVECFPGIEQTPMFAVLRECMEDRKPRRMENEFTYADGSRGWFELRFIPVPEGVCVLSLDVSEAKRTTEALAKSQEQLQHSQKMEAIGRLAGGVAHDFNNVLAVILSYSKLAAEDLSADDPLRSDLHEIHEAGMRAASLTRQLLAFSRQQALDPRVMDVHEVVTHMENMLGRLIGEHIRLTIRAGRDLYRVRADPGQIEQVLMNLAVNARDAMPAGGELIIATANAKLDEENVRGEIGLKPGEYVLLSVTDTGVGMDGSTQSRIFEPFFTTKPSGQGTGLGLSIVFGIVQQSGGTVRVTSAPGEGSSFKVYLPKTDDVASDDDDPLPPVTDLGGNETILVVEDEDQVRTLARTILGRYGYRVLEARDGAEALLAVEQQAGAIDLVLSDVVMPVMDGLELARRLASIRPGMKVLHMSGYSDEARIDHARLDRGAAFLSKPFTPESLARRVRKILGSRR